MNAVERERRGAEITARYMARARRDPTDPWIPLPMLIPGPDMRPQVAGVGPDLSSTSMAQCICGCSYAWHWLSPPHSCNECKTCQGYSPTDRPISETERCARVMQAITGLDRGECERSIARWYQLRLDPKIEIVRLSVALNKANR